MIATNAVSLLHNLRDLGATLLHLTNELHFPNVLSVGRITDDLSEAVLYFLLCEDWLFEGEHGLTITLEALLAWTELDSSFGLADHH